MGYWIEEAWTWNLEWRRTLYEWENDEVSTLKHHIEQKCPNREMVDGVYWKNSSNVGYPVKSVVEKMNESYAPILPNPIINLVWQNFLPPRAQMTVWMANLDKLKTGDYLLRLGIIDPQQAVCPFCILETESNNHTLFTCRFSLCSWMKMLEWWNISGALHNQCSTFTIQWFGLVKNRKLQKLWGMILGCVIWSLWYERNKIKFDRGSPNLHNFVCSLKIRIGIWAKEMMGFSRLSPNDVKYNIDSILRQT